MDLDAFSGPFRASNRWRRIRNIPPTFSMDEHYVMKGASPVTARELVRPSFRNWFYGDYPYMYAKFRCVA